MSRKKCKCCNNEPCVGCTCSEETQIQITCDGWENGYCAECTALNDPIILPPLETFDIDAFATCFDTDCDLGCDPIGPKCLYGIEDGLNDCTQIGLTPALTNGAYCDGGGCPDEFQVCFLVDTVYDVMLDTPHGPYVRNGCNPNCTAVATCGEDPEDPENTICLGGMGGTVTDCDPMPYIIRCMIYQTADKARTAVSLQIIVGEFISFSGSGCAIYDGPCDTLDVDVPITLCSSPDSQWRPGDALPRYRCACYLPASVNVMAI